MTDRPSLTHRVSSPRNILSFLFGGALLVLTARSITDVDWNSAVTYLRETDPLVFLLAFGVFHGLSIVRALRWQVLLRNTGYRLHANGPFSALIELTRIIYLGWFANCVTVARLGDVYRCSLLQRSTDIELSVTAGTVLTERIVDFGVLIVALGGSVMIVFWGDFPPFIANAMLVGIAAFGIGGIGFLLLQHASESIEQVLPTRFRQTYRRVRHGTIDSLDRIPTLLGYTAISWVLEGLTMYLVAVALGVQLSFPSAFVAALVAVLLSTIPVTPGGLGITEAGIAVVLNVFGLNATAIAAITILNRLISYWSIVAIGLLLYAIGLRVPIALSATPDNKIRTIRGESKS